MGTNFVDSVANALCCHSVENTLSVMPKPGVVLGKLETCGGALPCTDESWGKQFKLGPVHRGQKRDVVVHVTVPPGHTGPVLECVAEVGSEKSEMVVVGVGGVGDEAVWRKELLRDLTVTTCYAAVEMATNNKGKAAVEAVAKLGVETKSDGIGQDVSGRMKKALTGKDRFNRYVQLRSRHPKPPADIRSQVGQALPEGARARAPAAAVHELHGRRRAGVRRGRV